MSNPGANRLDERNRELARDLTWHAWIAARSYGLASLWLVLEEDQIVYGLVRSGNVLEE